MNLLRKFTPRNFRKGILLFEKLLIVLVSTALYVALLFLFHKDIANDLSQLFILILIHFVIFIVLFTNYRCDKIGTLRLRELIFSYALSCFITDAVSFLILIIVSETPVNILHFLVMFLAQVVAGIVLYVIANRTYYILNPAVKAVAICSDSRWEKESIHKFKNTPAKYRIEKVMFGTDNLGSVDQELGEYDMVILGDIERRKKAEIISYCFEKNKRLYILPSIQNLMINSATATQNGDSMVLLLNNKPMTMEQLLIKRVVDIIVPSIALVILSPLLLITALLIKMYDKGPVFFKQERYTRNNEVFTLIKFRSMIVDAEKNGAQFTVPDDKRITPIGKFIRATRIDELPQLLNIIKGDMSIVGPRAERVENADAYSEMMPEFRYRTKVKAGLTGYAQVYGKYNTSPEDKLRMDLHYINNYSLLMDLKLLLYTVKVVFMKESTEGFENETLEEEFDIGKEDKKE
ncbi:MAG: exopolysaccharide biosynthesis polyprenyl glycosylphosphotransferase [Clostridia bacterium]|nr:exopolysaccharide biosynthesis polyprenyl glycosylphosphotransferase [Clostridia bacterium]